MGKLTKPKDLKEVASISSKDAKILWARAAGRCSMPDCRIELTLDKDNKDTALTFGEMCHIVGEKEDAPRGKSTLTNKERNAYHNLVLFCANHHTIIDKYEEKYPIEVLHKIKTDHELWVQESLSAKKLKPDDLLYSSLIDFIALQLRLDQWDWFMDNAARQILHEYFVDAYEAVLEKKLSIDFPKTKLELETTLKNVMDAYIEFIEYFLTAAHTPDRGGDFYTADRSYKRVHHNPRYLYYSEKNVLWARKCFALLCLYTVRLNEFVKAVRKFSNPYFYILRGKFLVYDNLGTHNDGEPVIITPTYSNILKRLNALNAEIKIFEEKYKEE